jgi:hypothetical protein
MSGNHADGITRREFARAIDPSIAKPAIRIAARHDAPAHPGGDRLASRLGHVSCCEQTNREMGANMQG